MSYQLTVRHLFVEDGDVSTIGFADDETAPERYVLIQKQWDCSGQDVQLGLDKVHIEVDDQLRSVYGGIKSVSVSGGRILIHLLDKANADLQIDQEIQLDVDAGMPSFSLATSLLQRICAEEGIAFES
ncbi:MAG: hypothetical protein KF800_11885 [Lysobacter sp.]|nr:hypothetical protein [Lysobacter sp.]